jgi:hypothetical protein
MPCTVIVDFDGTLTAEETQVASLADRSLDTLSGEILQVPRRQLVGDYATARARLLEAPHLYCWEVNGLVASYCDEGAFILNTTTLQVMLRANSDYVRAVAVAFPDAEYDPVVDCTNHLFHRHTAEFPPAFRDGARDVLAWLLGRPEYEPVVLTNSLGDKVRRHLDHLALGREIAVLGDTRQYDMAPHWRHHFAHPYLGPIQVWPVSTERRIDLRRPAYYRALVETAHRGGGFSRRRRLVVVADTLSLPGALPLMMGIPFFLLRTSYTPTWCAEAVDAHPSGQVLESLSALPTALEALDNL